MLPARHWLDIKAWVHSEKINAWHLECVIGTYATISAYLCQSSFKMSYPDNMMDRTLNRSCGFLWCTTFLTSCIKTLITYCIATWLKNICKTQTLSPHKKKLSTRPNKTRNLSLLTQQNWVYQLFYDLILLKAIKTYANKACIPSGQFRLSCLRMQKLWHLVSPMFLLPSIPYNYQHKLYVKLNLILQYFHY
jgi:hypothetical protein